MSVLLYPLTTEKAVRAIEAENKMTFVVTRNAAKGEIAKELAIMFKAKVASVNVQIRNNKKIAVITLKKETPAIDIATKLGMI
jgi:ribosomal protein L23